MNAKAFIHYINQQLETFVHVCSPTGFLLESFAPHQTVSDSFLEWPLLLRTLTDFSEDEIPRLVSVNDRILYGAVQTPDFIYIVGPVRCVDTPDLRIRMRNPHFEDTSFNTVPVCEYDYFLEDILLIYNLYADKLLRSDVLALYAYDTAAHTKDVQTNYSHIRFERQENVQRHNPYDQEIRLLDSITQGDIAALEQCWHEEEAQNSYGTLSRNRLQNVKNLCVATTTLASRAAIRGGLTPEIAFSICDSYVQRIDTGADSLSCAALVHESQREYTLLVAELRHTTPAMDSLKPSPHLSKCKDYIYAHLHEQITIEEIAEAVHLNTTYLAGLFKKYEGCTIHHFILSEKIKLVKNLLKYSNYTYSEIASYLAFSSQSHLGAQFKKITGYTLREYRVKFGSDSFQG